MANPLNYGNGKSAEINDKSAEINSQSTELLTMPLVAQFFCRYVKYSKRSNMFLLLFLNKVLFIRAGIYKSA